MSTRSFLNGSTRTDYVMPSGGVQPMELFAPRDDWTSDVYGRLTGGRRGFAEKDPSPVTRVLSFIFAVLVLLLGVALIAMGIVLRTGQLIEFCSNCTGLLVTTFVLGSVTVIVSGIGIASLCIHNAKPLSITYGTMLLLMAVLCFAVGGTTIYFRDGGSSDTVNFDSLWRKLVRRDSEMICALQQALSCSGFAEKQCCHSDRPFVPAPQVSASLPPQGVQSAHRHAAADGDDDDDDEEYCFLVAPDNASMALAPTPPYDPIEWPHWYCVADCEANAFTTTCKEPLEDKVHELFVALLVVFFVLGAVFLLFAGVAFYRSTVRRDRVGYVQYEY